MLSAKLIVEEGELKGTVFSLDQGEEWSLGASQEDNTFSLSAEGVAPTHFLLTKSDNTFFLKANDPLKLNGQLTEEASLKEGDLIEINGNKIRFLMETATSEPLKPDTSKEESAPDEIEPTSQDDTHKDDSEMEAFLEDELNEEGTLQDSIKPKSLPLDESLLEEEHESEATQNESITPEPTSPDESLLEEEHESEATQNESITPEPTSPDESLLEEEHESEATQNESITPEPTSPDESLLEEEHKSEATQNESITPEPTSLDESLLEEEHESEATQNESITPEPTSPDESLLEEEHESEATQNESITPEPTPLDETHQDEFESEPTDNEYVSHDSTPSEDTTKEESQDNAIIEDELDEEDSVTQKGEEKKTSSEKQSDTEDEDTIFDEEEKDDLADLNFDLMGTGRYLLKVIGGPNNGAEFSMHSDATYIIGTDPTSCDVVFHDTSVSRQHLKITIDSDNHPLIEDLNSRNGVFIDGQKLTSKQTLNVGKLVSLGTTSFMLFDREGEMHTIISPPPYQEAPKTAAPVQPEIKEEIQEEIEKPTQEVNQAAQVALKETVVKETRDEHKSQISKFGLYALITGILVLTGLAISTLFQEAKPIDLNQKTNIDKALEEALSPFPDVRYSFNKATGKLLLVGHVSSPSDRNQLLYNLQGLHFLSLIDSSGIIVDEYVWREINQVLSRNKAWKGITIQSTSPGHYTISGTVKTRKQAEELSDYVSSNFPYLDKLDNKILVEEDVINSVTNELKINRLSNLQVEFSNGLLTITGSVSNEQKERVNQLIDNFKKIPGVRSIKSFIGELAPESKLIDISDKFTVSGVSQIGSNISVIINGKILSKGDNLNGMTIISITRNEMRLTKDGVEYRIVYK